MTISVLRPELATQIAAGEVVERPVSVVKELVENSIDAGASQIIVQISGGGIEQIQVTDDGMGIPSDEVALAFKHHATSKLTTQEQLDAIATLGFRGEALPSIVAVAGVTITSRPQGEQAGHQIEFQWGEKIREGPQGAPPGTSITVSELFANLPARRKFLKSNSAEAGRIHELVSRYALAYPDISFVYSSEGRTSISTPGNDRPAEALLAVYGREAAAAMLEVHSDYSETGYKIDGFISPPSLTRANRTYMSFFINRRWIQNRMLSFALEEAYHGLLQERRYPIAVINLTIPYPDVDVNYHPAKREVRFHQERTVYSTMQRAVRAALMLDSPVPTMSSGNSFSTSAQARPPAGSGPGFFHSPFNRSSTRAVPRSPARETNVAGVPGPADAAATYQQALPALRVVGQIKSTYIVADGPDGMYVVDQHAAHERVLFDRICRHAAAKSPQSQPLLGPVAVELTPSQEDNLRSNAEYLTSYGFDVESFGGTSYLLRAVPTIMTGQDPARSLVDVLDLVAVDGLVRQHEDVLAASIACHAAIRAGKSLTEAEMVGLLGQLEATDSPLTCPHGRPTLMHFSDYQMERGFGRR